MTNQTGDAGVVRTQNARQGLLSPLNRGRNFPHDIAVAIVAITTGSAFHDLPRNARSVLAFAVRVAERKDPTKPSWAFKKTIAKEIGISESTVYRVLNVLVDNGFIERFEQERKAHNGKLAVARMREQSLRAVQRDNHLREVSTERLNRMNGNFLVSTNGESVHQIDATTQTAEVWWREEGTGRIRNGQAPINAAYVAALAAGRLKPIDRECRRGWECAGFRGLARLIPEIIHRGFA